MWDSVLSGLREWEEETVGVISDAFKYQRRRHGIVFAAIIAVVVAVLLLSLQLILLTGKVIGLVILAVIWVASASYSRYGTQSGSELHPARHRHS